MTVNRSAFVPPPKVTSAVVHIVPADQPPGVDPNVMERLTEAERRFYTALMEDRPSEEVQVAAHDLDEARTKYRKISDAIG